MTTNNQRKQSTFRLTGLVPAVFTPLREDGSLDLDRIPGIVDHLEQDGVSALYVLGSTGEGVSLSSQERRDVAEAYVQVAGGRLPTVVQVGHNSLAEARQLAEHAQRIGASAISATPPYYFQPESVDVLVACMEEITAAAPELPFYYYHIPVKTRVMLDMVAFLRVGAERLPTLAGLKFSDLKLYELQACQQLQNGRFNVLLGPDEMLLSALAIGTCGAVGTTYNFAAPLYLRVIEAFEQGNLEMARHLQGLAVAMIDIILKHCGRPGFKAMMAVIGQDCGPHRLPHGTARPEDVARMTKALEAIGFFEWGRSKEAYVENRHE